MKALGTATSTPGADPAPGMPAALQRPADGGQAVLQRDLGHFLVDLSIALHRFAMYPPGHPSLTPALETLARRADALLQDRPRFAVGVARDQLVIEGVVTDERHPLLRSLAERLHRHHLSALSFCRGVSIGELAVVLKAIAEDPDRGGACLGAGRPGAADAWPHVCFHPLLARGLEIVSDQESDGRPIPRAAELWIGLAQAALGRAPGAESPVQEAEPAALARAIDDHQRVEAYDQVIVGYMHQIAEEVRDARDPDTLELRHRVSTLVSSMRPDTLRRLLTMGGHARQRQQFLRSAAAGMRAGAVVSLVRAAAEAQGGAVSNGLMRVLRKLAVHAETGAPSVQPLADSALREQVEALATEWTLADPNPADYTEGLERIARETLDAGTARAERSQPLAEPARLLEICLELDEGGPALAHAVDAMLDAGQARDAIAVLEPIRSDGPGREGWERVVSPTTVTRLLAGAPPDLASLDVLLPHLCGEALAPLFDVLLGSEDRHLRRAVYDRLRRTGDAGATQALARLDDDRWYVVRNLLSLLAEMSPLPAETDPAPWLAHVDPRVRREALRVALRINALRDRAIWSGVADSDERVLRVAVNGALAHPHPSYRSQLLELADRDALGDDLRACAIEALARLPPGPDTLEVLLRAASSHARLLPWGGRPARSEAAATALRTLATHWPEDPRVVAALRQGEALLPRRTARGGHRNRP